MFHRNRPTFPVKKTYISCQKDLHFMSKRPMFHIEETSISRKRDRHIMFLKRLKRDLSVTIKAEETEKSVGNNWAVASEDW